MLLAHWALDVVDDAHTVAQPFGAAELHGFPDTWKPERFARVDGGVEVFALHILERVEMASGRIALFGASNIESDATGVPPADRQPRAAATAPGMPWVNTRRVGPIVRLGWSEGDSGNAQITGYDILRGTVTETETKIATVAGDQSRFDDLTATDTTKTYFYKVVATNSVGSSCANNEISTSYLGDTCTGILIHKNDTSHPESAQAAANPALAIDSVSVGKPMGAGNLQFMNKEGRLASIHAKRRRSVVWDKYKSHGQQFYVGDA